MLKKMVLATRNPGKVEEIKELLADLPLEIVSLEHYPQAPEVEEDRLDFAGNAVKKAQSAAQHTGEAALADDSGLEVKALGGRPGVHSARFAGQGAADEDNNRLLLEKLRGLPSAERDASFKCALALVLPGGETHIIEESCPGKISEDLRGAGGFGYDPLFIYESAGQTFAEMNPSSKNLVSHRGRALSKLRKLLTELLNTDNNKSSNAIEN